LSYNYCELDLEFGWIVVPVKQVKYPNITSFVSQKFANLDELQFI